MKKARKIIDEYLSLARGTNAFKPQEIDVLEELVTEALTDDKTTYVMREEREGSALTGFIIYGATPAARFTWDLYWIVVGAEHQGKGIGKKLLRTMEKDVLRGKKAVIRVETSGTPSYEQARNYYLHTGFETVGVIRDFYDEKDDLVIFAKYL
jgi:ribosomal protein S18 acetylase RimI-like enzyme